MGDRGARRGLPGRSPPGALGRRRRTPRSTAGGPGCTAKCSAAVRRAVGPARARAWTWRCPSGCSPRRCRSWRPTCGVSSRPKATSRARERLHGRRARHDLRAADPGRAAAARSVRHLRAGRLQARPPRRTARAAGRSASRTPATAGSSPTRSASSTRSSPRSSSAASTCPGVRALTSSGWRSRGSSRSARWRSTTSRPRAANTSPAASGCTTASSWPSTTRWTRSWNWYREEGLIFKGGSGAGLNLSRIRSSQGAALLRRHRLRPGVVHARCRRLRRHDQVRRRHPAGGEDGRPRRRPPGHRGVHRDQGARGGQDPGAARRRVRHGPRRQGHHQRPVPERQQLGAGHRRVHAGGRGGRRVRAARPGRPARSSRPSTPRICSARSPRPPGNAPTRASSTTTRSTTGTPTRRPGRITASQPVLGVHEPGQLLLQPRQPQPAQVPARRRHLRRWSGSPRPSSSSSRRWTSRSASRTSRPRRSPTTTRGVPPARHRLRQPRRAADGDRPAYDSEGGRASPRRSRR